VKARVQFLGGIILICLASGFVFLWYVSPWLYASSVTAAAQARDLSVFSRRIDVGRIIASSSDELSDSLSSGARLHDGTTASPALRSLIGGAMRIVVGDDALFADKFANLLTGRGFVSMDALSQVPKQLIARRTPVTSSEYGDTMDIFVQQVSFKETGEAVAVVYERSNWYTWRVVSTKLSSPSALLPIKLAH
jgi:hypothetical protein